MMVRLACAVLIGAHLFSQPVAAREPVELRAAARGDTPLVVMDWPQPVEYSVGAAAGIYVVRFARPFAGNFADLQASLADVVDVIEPGSDAFELVVVVKPGVEMRLDRPRPARFTMSFLQETTAPPAVSPPTLVTRPVAVAAAESAPTLADVPPPQADRAPSAPATLDNIVVRTGRQAGKARLVFDWPDTSYRLTRDGDVVHLAFDRPAAIDLSTVERTLGGFIESATATQASGDSRVELRLAAGAELRHFTLDDGRIIVDVLRAGQGRRAQAVAQRAPAAQTGTAADDAPTPRQVAGSGDASGEAEADPVVAEATASGADAATDAELAADSAAATAQTEAQRAALSGTPITAGTNALASEVRVAAPDNVSEANPQRAGRGADMQLVPVIEDYGLDLHFSWRRPAAAAAFTRAGYLWIAFNQPLAESARTTLPADGIGGYIGPMQHLATPEGSVFIAPMAGEFTLSAQRNATVWTISLQSEGEAAPRSAEIVRMTEPDRLIVSDAASALNVADPEVGDRLTILPLATPGVGLPEARRLVDVYLLDSAQGVAFAAVSDGVTVSEAPSGVAITRPDGLRLSPPGRSAAASIPASRSSAQAAVVGGN